MVSIEGWFSRHLHNLLPCSVAQLDGGCPVAACCCERLADDDGDGTACGESMIGPENLTGSVDCQREDGCPGLGSNDEGAHVERAHSDRGG